MKTFCTIFVAAILVLPFQAEAQFSFPKGKNRNNGGFLPDLGKHVQDQIRREVNNHGQRIIGEIDRVIGGGGRIVEPLPWPRPQPQPWPQPIPTPHPVPLPVPHPIVRPQPPVYLPHPERIISTPPEEMPIAPGQETEELPQIAAGQIVDLEGEFDSNAGAVVVKIESLVMTAEVVEWSSNNVQAKLPSLPMAAPVQAVISVVNANGETATEIQVKMTPGTDEDAEDQTEDLPVIEAGQEVAIEGDLGEQQGKVQLHIGGLVLDAQITKWNASELSAQIPVMSFNEPVNGKLVITRADGEIADQLDVQFHPSSPMAESDG